MHRGEYAAQVLPGPIGLQALYLPDEYGPGKKYVQLGEVGNRPCQVPKNAKEFDLPPLEMVPAKNIAGRIVDEQDRPLADVRIGVLDLEAYRRYGSGKSDKNGEFTVTGVPAALSAAKLKYEWAVTGFARPRHCQVLKADPLVLRALPAKMDYRPARTP